MKYLIILLISSTVMADTYKAPVSDPITIWIAKNRAQYCSEHTSACPTPTPTPTPSH